MPWPWLSYARVTRSATLSAPLPFANWAGTEKRWRSMITR
jgi:hypothetical protein